MGQAFRIGFQIHLDLAFSDNIAGLGVVFEIRSVDLIEAAGVASVKRDGDIVQFGAAALLELHRLAGLDFEQRVSLFGSGDGETLRALLDLNANFRRNFLERVLHPVAGVKIHRRDHQHQPNGACRKPATEAGYGKRHLRTV